MAGEFSFALTDFAESQRADVIRPYKEGRHAAEFSFALTGLRQASSR